ncbi:hypothetical protein [Enterocloster clostridioformis]|jgi:hypothetical protein|uniref:Uncharacterized protein n=1 Tax=Enterocloster clostridioformis TaxID=1531 RepID=A0A829W5S0_9FIRM|nr:hypothetical protein [Enterocloster clostridioformis]DAY95321.1 MAG TPA: hypothetical protein [Caudoviricetes sp.]EHG33557.1 hypothetical protein HMPREF9467_00762 [ [[Clostridium] clostridioforme 2_1_49FAA]ENZ28744.1 hypothetical protein HMPREF1087_01240 [[Clostridium] clostridioforme 90A1]ENZ72433.1 hypothetical protein HMPREF1081_00848 [[Clostridium] clostridioforme 90A4]QIX93891.1 hypothetical protein FOC47_27115 [Enterocloster clostridioformis]
MIRDFRINGAKAPDAMHKAKVDMVTGMGVVKEDSTTDKFANIASAETVTDIFIVDKERVPSGINCARGDMSDYDNDFVKIKANEPVSMDKYHAGEKFGTDQYDDTITSDLALNTRVSWKNGLVTKATIASPYVFKGFHNDNRHSLAQIEVSDTAVSNA